MIKDNQSDLDHIGWGQQLENWTRNGQYRNFAHLYNLSSFLDSQDVRNALDVGCGTGALLELCQSRNIEAFGADISKEILNYHAQRTNFKVYHADINEMVIDQKFDLVICHGLIEHLESPLKGAKELLKITQNNGHAIISVPNMFSLFPLFVPIWFFTGGRYKHGWREMVGEMFTQSSFKKLLEEAGWEVEEIKPFKAGSFCDWAGLPFKPFMAKFVEKNPIISNIFGIMLSATCKKVTI